LERRMTNAYVAFWDLETTGFVNQYSTSPDDQPGIVQIGAAVTDASGNILREYNQLVNPELSDPSKWREDAMQVSGIFPEHVEDAPTLHTALPEFAEFLIGCHFMAGYNHIAFDNVVMMFNLLRYGYEHCFPWPPNHIDLMPICEEKMNQIGKQGRKAPKLVEAYEEFVGKEMENAHDALFDVRGTAEIFKSFGGLEGLGYW